MKILVVATGGTIGSVRNGTIVLDENNLKIIEHCKRENVELVGVSPYSVLSENIGVEHWRMLFDYLNSVDFDAFDGVIILHGSDTLAYTSAIIGNAFPNDSIVLVAADKPIEDEDSNGIYNFNLALDMLEKGITSPIVCYDDVHSALGITSADVNDIFFSIDTDLVPVCSRTIYEKSILIIKAYPTIDMSAYNFDNTDAVIVDMFHSATVPDGIKACARDCKAPFYFVTHKASADYDTAQDIDNIVYNCTVENAFARLLLTK